VTYITCIIRHFFGNSSCLYVCLFVVGIRLRFHGYASVHWVERYSSGTGKNKRTVTKHFDSDEQYFDHTVYVFGKLISKTKRWSVGT
jgi:hypothetical protein